MTCSPTGLTAERLGAAFTKAQQSLLAERVEAGHWVGELSTSALSTATAVSALAAVFKAGSPDSDQAIRDQIPNLIACGVRWLAAHQNQDGGWGDTQTSHSNISTTLLAQAAFHLAGVASEHGELLQRAEAYVTAAGSWPGLRERYGRDKTFAVPILTNCALAGMIGWRDVSPLPFEMACFPQSMYRMLRLPVVSYAIPALVAIGQARYFHRPPFNPLTRWIRSKFVDRSLRVLERMQPASGGYLEAVPLTSFVVMSLATTGRAGHAVTRNGVRFLMESVRPDGSWPIDTNLATWNTSLSLNALAAGGMDIGELKCLDWLLACQTKQIHPFTGAEPGGWGWTDLTGSVPDADDTPGALIALATWSRSRVCSRRDRRRIRDAAAAGVRWLLGLQNTNGGWPTFCRGWGKLPFDRSGADLTAHAIRALHGWRDLVDSQREIQRGLKYLASAQRSDGSWVPLWFGNQDHPREENPVYGTAKVLLAYHDLGLLETLPAKRGLAWLRAAQNADGGWGGGRSLDPSPNLSSMAPTTGGSEQVNTPAANAIPLTQSPSSVTSSVEETAVALEALLAAHPADSSFGSVPERASETNVFVKGLTWLVDAIETDRYQKPSPIGFYFAKLWYHEKLYPIIFATAALGRAVQRGASSAEGSPAKSHLVSVVADTERFPERSESTRQLVPMAKDDTASGVSVIKQPCP